MKNTYHVERRLSSTSKLHNDTNQRNAKAVKNYPFTNKTFVHLRHGFSNTKYVELQETTEAKNESKCNGNWQFDKVFGQAKPIWKRSYKKLK